MNQIDEKVILPDSPEAASIKTVTGWVSRTGRFWGDDERTARYDGSTHKLCEKCGGLVEQRGYCGPCADKKEVDKYESMQAKPWDGVCMVYSIAAEKYYSDPYEAFDDLEGEDAKIETMMLVLCEPNKIRLFDEDYFSDDLAEDGELPDEIEQAINAFNDALRAAPVLSWWPGNFKLDTSGMETT